MHYAIYIVPKQPELKMSVSSYQAASMNPSSYWETPSATTVTVERNGDLFRVDGMDVQAVDAVAYLSGVTVEDIADAADGNGSLGVLSEDLDYLVEVYSEYAEEIAQLLEKA